MSAHLDSQNVARSIASECVGARIRTLNRKISRVYDEAIRPHGIKFSQMNIVTVVGAYGPIQPVEVGRMLSLEKSTLSRNVALMEANGWIEVLPGDGNTQLLRATREGRNLLKAAAPSWREAQARGKNMLGSESAAELRRATDRIIEQESVG